jgi:hypothetical protein
MRKCDELTDLNSCLSKADDDEMVFVLRGHDETSPLIILQWVVERIRYKKNKLNDPQIQEALECARIMEEQRDREQERKRKRT